MKIVQVYRQTPAVTIYIQAYSNIWCKFAFDSLRGGRYRFRTPLEARAYIFSIPILICPGLYPASSTVGNVALFWGPRGRCLAFTIQAPLMPMLRMSTAITVHVVSRGHVYHNLYPRVVERLTSFTVPNILTLLLRHIFKGVSWSLTNGVCVKVLVVLTVAAGLHNATSIS